MVTKPTIRHISARNHTGRRSEVVNRNQGINFLFENAEIPLANERMVYFIYFPQLSKGDRQVCKIGYAMDLKKRLKSIEADYKIKPVLIDAIQVLSLHDESMLHSECRKRFSKLVYGEFVNGKFRRELYLFRPSLFRFYRVFCKDQRELVKTARKLTFD